MEAGRCRSSFAGIPAPLPRQAPNRLSGINVPRLWLTINSFDTKRSRVFNPVMDRRRDIAAARAALGWSWDTLAKRAGVSRRTATRVEAGDQRVSAANVEAVIDALKAGGITFLPANSQGPGIRYKPK